MDYLLVDRASVHEDEAPHYSEKLWFLPDTRLCLSESPIPVAVSPLPALVKGYVTFGSYQTPSKVTDATLAVWSQVLQKLPTARLRLQLRGFEFAESVKIFVPASKIELVQKYVGGMGGAGRTAPTLSALGGSRWKKQKESVAESVQDLAAELLRVRAARERFDAAAQ